MARRVSVHSESGHADKEIVIDWSCFDEIEKNNSCVGGFTVADVRKKYGWGESKARINVRKLLAEGKIKRIGTRIVGSSHVPVYDTVGK